MKVISVLLLTALCVGCQPVSLFPGPPQTEKPVAHTLTIKVEDGKLTIGDGTLNVKSENVSKTPPLCPCCGATGACRGLCGKPGCVCSRGEASAVPSVGIGADLPQFTTQVRTRMVCIDGVCRPVTEEVRVPIASVAKRSASPLSNGGRITIYDNGSPAGRAMRDAIGSKGVDWERRESPVAIDGIRWSPTAVKSDGSAWTPGANGWHSLSASQFEEWRTR